MRSLPIHPLDTLPENAREQAIALLVASFGNPERYGIERIREQLAPASPPFYRQFFAALSDDTVLGIAGIKAADWASDTHILYLSAVTPEHRGQGIGRALVKARLDWVEAHFKHGRILVSTGKPRRFRHFGFSEVPYSVQEGRRLMMRRF